MPLVTGSQVLAWATPNASSGVDSTVLDICIAAATSMVEGLSSRVLEAGNRTEQLDGRGPRIGGRISEVLQLDIRKGPVTSITSVTESGVALTVATQYSLTAGVIASLAAGRLVRVAGAVAIPWAEGVQNIVVVWVGGYDSTTVPAQVKLLLYEYSWLLYQAANKVGVENATKRSLSQSYALKLSANGKAILDSLRIYGVPGV